MPCWPEEGLFLWAVGAQQRFVVSTLTSFEPRSILFHVIKVCNPYLKALFVSGYNNPLPTSKSLQHWYVLYPFLLKKSASTLSVD